MQPRIVEPTEDEVLAVSDATAAVRDGLRPEHVSAHTTVRLLDVTAWILGSKARTAST